LPSEIINSKRLVEYQQAAAIFLRALFEIRIESKIIRMILRCSSESVRSIMTNGITVRKLLTARSRKIVFAFVLFKQEASVQSEHHYLLVKK